MRQIKKHTDEPNGRQKKIAPQQQFSDMYPGFFAHSPFFAQSEHI